jgi:hypothetical protein
MTHNRREPRTQSRRLGVRLDIVVAGPLPLAIGAFLGYQIAYRALRSFLML